MFVFSFFSALMLSATKGHLDVVKLLINTDQKPQINARSKKGISALMAASRDGRCEVKVLFLFFPFVFFNK